ncbi:receptor kinase-like protein Xa21 [Asparagus officinalis]|uniref:receptor kinase-like protein Xa21 n=1 Tax=Asparagus officinalis TaxID=4686 RepID=UPI00098E5A5D|nr:receptor kinase-like protein Xa21 [Asparagus officinalis]
MEIYLFLFVAMHFFLFFISSAVHDNFTDLSALLAFKDHVTDPNGILSSSWTTNTSFCSWTGVSCSRQRQRVVALNLSSLSLSGTIPPQITNLSFLSYIQLSNNSFVGPITDSFAQLPRLKSLILERNRLSGSVPPAIFNMSSITELSLRYNNLSGTLPSNDSLHAILPQVQFLFLSTNLLSGNIPSSLSNCHHLQVLSMAVNRLSGNIPSELGNLQQLRLLYLGVNYLTGTMPASLGNLTNLVALDLPYLNIHGNIPEQLGRLSNLESLNLASNHGVTGPFPISLSNISKLNVLDLSDEQLTGPVPPHFGNMPQLETLLLTGNNLTGGLDFLSTLSNSRVLETIDLGRNELDGSLANTIGNLSKNLQILVVARNHIKGKIPAELGNLTSLWDLNLGNNEFVGRIPSELRMLQGLQSLVLGNNRIHGSIPHELGQLRSLNTLSLSGNHFSGSIPDTLGNISSLQHLILSGNELSSGIPENMWSLSGLIELSLSQNYLSGSLSSRVGNLKSLDMFNTSMNRLSGTIPSTFRDLQMLRSLDLSNNSFDGQIPPSFGELISIEVLNLSCNNLSGAIPNSLANLRYIRSINLSFNKLEGEIPKGAAFSNLTITSLVGNVALCGAPKLGFSPCPPKAAVSNSRMRMHLLKYILPAVACTIALVTFFCILLIPGRKKTEDQAATDSLSPNDHSLISYNELVRATENFNEMNLLGKGGFSSVYKGCLDDGLVTAIKVLNVEPHGGSSTFDVEHRTLCMVRHRNLIKIIGICCSLDFRALVLEFMPNGSLERWLYSHNYCLDLLQRINIVIDVASAVEYLHHHHFQVVVHCDLKPSNILIDKNMTARVSDFGIAKLLLGDSWAVASASTPGTLGYIPPEYALTGRVSRKGDVYSFGILLLEIFTRKKPTDPIKKPTDPMFTGESSLREIFTRKKPTDPMFTGESSLRRWVCEAHPTTLLDIVDHNLLKDGSGNARSREDLIRIHACISSILKLGVICSRGLPKERPEMKEIVPKLQKIKTDYLSVSSVA